MIEIDIIAASLIITILIAAGSWITAQLSRKVNKDYCKEYLDVSFNSINSKIDNLHAQIDKLENRIETERTHHHKRAGD